MGFMNLVNAVLLYTDQTIEGIKTFIQSPKIRSSDNTHFATLSFTGTSDKTIDFETLGGSGSGGVRQTVQYASVGTDGKPNYITLGTGLSVNVLCATTNVKMSFAGGLSDTEHTLTTDEIISGLSASATNYLYADKTSGTLTLGATTIAPEYVSVLPDTAFPTFDPTTKGSATVLSNGNLTTTKTATAWSNASVYATKTARGAKFYAEVTIGTIGTGGYCQIGITTVNTYQAGAIGDSAGGYSYRDNAFKINGGTATSYGATYANGDVIAIMYDSTTGALEFKKNNVSQGVAFTLTPDTAVYLAVSLYGNTNTVTVNYGASAFAYSLPSGYMAWNAERVSGKHFFDTTKMEMYVANGTGYDKKLRLFKGEAITDATNVTSVVNYALNGFYDSGDFATTAISTAKTHNIGVYPTIDKLLLNGITQNIQITQTNKTYTWTASVGTSRIIAKRSW